jgi:hypothetical protein
MPIVNAPSPYGDAEHDTVAGAVAGVRVPLSADDVAALTGYLHSPAGGGAPFEHAALLAQNTSGNLDGPFRRDLPAARRMFQTAASANVGTTPAPTTEPTARVDPRTQQEWLDDVVRSGRLMSYGGPIPGTDEAMRTVQRSIAAAPPTLPPAVIAALQGGAASGG